MENLENLNKYSKKIIYELKNYLQSEYISLKYNDHSIINNMINIFNNIEYVLLKPIKSIIIKKLISDNTDPLIYQILNELDEFKKYNINNFSEFIKWYRENHNLLNIKHILKKKSPKYYDLLFNPINERQKLHNMLYDNFFVPIDVIHHAESVDLVYTIYEGNNSKLIIYKPVNSKKDINIELISKIISFFRILFKKDMHIDLTVFYGKQKKYISYTKYICTDNVNSGSTCMNCGPATGIMIWREEEFYKVLIHELIHYFGIDFYTNDNIYQQVDKIFKKHFNIEGIDKVNESYTEILAITIHSVIYSCIHKYNINDILSYELLFSNYQVGKLFIHFNIDPNSNNNIIYQKTSACSYYIIKCIFLNNLNIFLDFWNINGFFILGNNEKYYKKIYNDIVNIKSLNIKCINNIILFIKNNTDKNNFVSKTMRMSLFQL
jgi:hypothetical protein